MEQNRIAIQNKIDLLVKDMGKSTFLKLLRFVVEIMQDEHDIKVFMARRFLDIYLGFEEIVRYLYGDTIQMKGKVVTNLSVAALQDGLENQTILVVDDIRLHGRALDEMTIFLIESCRCLEENITLKVFVDNKDVVKVKNKYHPEIEIKESVNKSKWKKISSSIINALYITGQPYVSHLPYFEIESGTEAAYIIGEFIRREDVQEITTKTQEYYGVRSYLYFMECELDCVPFIEQNMIRIYVYKKIGKIIVVPYAFMKSLSSEGVLYYYKQLCDIKIIQGGTEEQNSDSAVTQSETLLKYLYSLEIYVTSLALGEQFIHDRALEGISWERAIEKYCFAHQLDVNGAGFRLFVSNLTDMEKEKYKDCIGSGLRPDDTQEITELIDRTDQMATDAFSVNTLLETYIKLSGGHDEKLAEQGRKRMHGMDYSRLCSWLSGATVQEVWKSIINIIDSGKGTLSASVNKTGQKACVDSLLFAGEQNGSCNECNLIYYIYPLLEYECRCRNDLTSNGKEEPDIQKGKDKVIDVISEKFPDLRKQVTDSEIEHLSKTSILADGFDYYMSRYPVYEQDRRLGEVLDATRFIGKG